jgi:hypothetical protein
MLDPWDIMFVEIIDCVIIHGLKELYLDIA